MCKRLEHLTHTNIHISPEEEIPQGVRPRHTRVGKQHTEFRRKTDQSDDTHQFRGRAFYCQEGDKQRMIQVRSSIKSNAIPLDWELLDTLVFPQASLECCVGGSDPACVTEKEVLFSGHRPH